MTAPLIDPKTVAQHRRRAQDMAEPAMFLQEHAAAQISERLSEVNKSFTDAAIVTGFPSVWRDLLPGAHIVPATEDLGLGPASFDLVVHALTLHNMNDPVGQMIQCRRALRPDGLFLAVLFGGRSLQELRTALAEAESRLLGGLSPRVTPMAELRDLGGLLQRAGFALPVADSDHLFITYADLPALMRDLRAMGEANPLTARRKGFTRRGLFDLAQRLYTENFAKDGRLTATAEMIYLTGWAPSENQQKPLRPGSAQARLADALGVAEHRTTDPALPIAKDRFPS